MKKIIFSFIILFFANVTLAYPVGYTVCPDVNSITVSISQGTATAPNGWSGINAIPLNNIKNWRGFVWQILVLPLSWLNEGECDYYLYAGTDIISLKKTLPNNYQLYSDSDNTSQTICWIAQPEINSGLNKRCYFYNQPL